MKSLLKRALLFFFVFIVFYLVLAGLSIVPSVATVLNKAYRAPTQPILSVLLPKAMLELKTDANDPSLMYIQYYSKKEIEEQKAIARQSGQTALNIQGDSTKIDLNSLFYTFWLFLVVLMVFSPISLKSKILNLVIGTVLFYLFTIFKTWLALLLAMSRPEIAIYDLQGFSLTVVGFLVPVMTVGINLLVLLIIWIVLVFNKNNWSRFLDLFGGNTVASDATKQAR